MPQQAIRTTWWTALARTILLKGLGGSDTIFGHEGDDTLLGGDGHDTLRGGDGNDSVRGGDGDDFIKGGDGEDTLFGGEGDDTISGGAGNNELRGQAGNDWVSFKSADGRVNVDLALQNATVFDGPDSYLLNTAQAQTVLGFENVIGSDHDDWIDGNSSDNVLEGGLGDDRIGGGGGVDTIEGGAGNDRLFAGAGGGALFGNDGDDTLFGGAATTTLSGGSGDDQLTGGDAVTTLLGGDNNDVLVIGKRLTRASGDAGNDTFKFNDKHSRGVLRVEDFDPGEDTITFFKVDRKDNVLTEIANFMMDLTDNIVGWLAGESADHEIVRRIKNGGDLDTNGSGFITQADAGWDLTDGGESLRYEARNGATLILEGVSIFDVDALHIC